MPVGDEPQVITSEEATQAKTRSWRLKLPKAEAPRQLRWEKLYSFCRQEQSDPVSQLPSLPVVGRWPARRPDCLQLYSVNAPDGVKMSMILEEIGQDCEATGFLCEFGKGGEWLERALARPAVRRELNIPV